ncbi:MAG: hypothetical protein ACXVCV_15295, partial [Polyangia bacterium]
LRLDGFAGAGADAARSEFDFAPAGAPAGDDQLEPGAAAELPAELADAAVDDEHSAGDRADAAQHARRDHGPALEPQPQRRRPADDLAMTPYPPARLRPAQRVALALFILLWSAALVLLLLHPVR